MFENWNRTECLLHSWSSEQSHKCLFTKVAFTIERLLVFFISKILFFQHETIMAFTKLLYKTIIVHYLHTHPINFHICQLSLVTFSN